MCRILILVVGILFLAACEGDFLDVKPTSNIIRLQTLDDLEKLLDNSDVINSTGVLQRMASDEYYIPDQQIWDGLFYATQRNAYLRKEDVYEGEANIKDWDNLYTAILYANSVLEELDRLSGKDVDVESNIQGRALFIRAYALYDLVNTFGVFYRQESAGVDLGVPIRLTSDINQIEKRATVQACYDRIVMDLQDAAQLLTNDVPPQMRTRQSKAAAYAMLARVHLTMADYDYAARYADTCLSIYPNITDFNEVDLQTDQPFQWNNNDVIYYTTQVYNYSTTSGVGNLTANYIGMDTTLLQQYDQGNDLRWSAFFAQHASGRYYRKMMFGSRSINLYPFTGLATDEIYLIQAESKARLGELSAARKSLTKLLEKRFVKGYSFDFDDLNQAELVDLILTERHKELVWRSTRWTDLKRLNSEGRNIAVQRRLGEDVSILEPNSPRYIFPIPDNELVYLK